MKRIEKTMILFSIIYLLISDLLLIIGERRIDVYLIILITIYYIYYTLEPELHSNNGLKKINPPLITLVAILAIYRIYLMITGGI